MASYARAGGWRALGQGLQGVGAMMLQTALANREREALEQQQQFQREQFEEGKRQFEVGRTDARERMDVDLQTRGFEITPAGQMTPGQMIRAAGIPGAAGIAANAAGTVRDGGRNPIRDSGGRQITYNQERDPSFVSGRALNEQQFGNQRTLQQDNFAFQSSENEKDRRNQRALAAMSRAGGGGGMTPMQQFQMLQQGAQGVAMRAAGQAARIVAEGKRPNFDPEAAIRNEVRAQFRNSVPDPIIQGIAAEAWAAIQKGAPEGQRPPSPSDEVSLWRGVVDMAGGENAEPGAVDSLYNAWRPRVFSGGGGSGGRQSISQAEARQLMQQGFTMEQIQSRYNIR